MTSTKYHFLASFTFIVISGLFWLTFPSISTCNTNLTLQLAEVDTVFSICWYHFLLHFIPHFFAKFQANPFSKSIMPKFFLFFCYVFTTTCYMYCWFIFCVAYPVFQWYFLLINCLLDTSLFLRYGLEQLLWWLLLPFCSHDLLLLWYFS